MIYRELCSSSVSAMEAFSPAHFQRENADRVSEVSTEELHSFRSCSHSGFNFSSAEGARAKASEKVENLEIRHTPVLHNEISQIVMSLAPGTFVDATIGAGGHSTDILSLRNDIRVIGIDRDVEALSITDRRFKENGFEGRYELIHGTFDLIGSLKLHEEIVGVLFDFGMSSMQVDDGSRGFSFNHEGPLDMRMDQSSKLSADSVVNEFSKEELARVIRDFGDERFAERIAMFIVRSRPILSTTQLASIVRDAIPQSARRTGGHPAKRTFQAIRILVNDEKSQLQKGIENAMSVVAKDGVVIGISYHSGEDREVKRLFDLGVTGGCVCPPQLPCVCGAQKSFAYLGPRKGLRPSPSELGENPRSKSAHLRAVRRIKKELVLGGSNGS